ncbi:MAG TPA: chemotaxis protein CheA [Solirubrobacteraceae bacterium]|nr:chemotaxis protein CheA [Solirubrobacteraceae bacterium]
MDTGEYLPMFLAESREHLQELNLAVVRIEETPDDAETIDEIFRAAHSLKGMSATMGFARIAAVTHAMEDLFEVLRVRSGGLDRESIDLLLECLDALSAAFEAIDTDGVESLEEGPLVARLQALVRSHEEHADAAPAHRPQLAELQAAAAGRRVVHVVLQLDDATLMPSVRAFMALAALSDHGEVLASLPASAEIDGFEGRTIEAWLASDHEDDVLAADARVVPDVIDVQLKEAVDEPHAQPAATSAPAAEQVSAPAAEQASAPAADEPHPGLSAPAAGERKAPATSTVRVDAERLDQLMHLMGELVVHRTHVESLLGHTEATELQHAMNDLTRSSQALQAMVMQIRMIPVEAVFLRFPRLVRDLSGKLEKKVDLRLAGTETELDRTVVDALGDPLVHLVRNSLDHGLEPPQEREAAGKPPTGTLEIAACHAGGSVLISVRDDGRGIDAAHVARKAAERGLIAPEDVASVDLAQAIELLFSAGFSTAEQTSDISGRGVGLDAVRSMIRALGGEVLVQSEPGAGTTTQIRLPLTLAIVATLIVDTQGQPYVVQLDRVEMTVKLADYPVRSVAGRRMLVLREEVLPISDLAGALGYGDSQQAAYGVVVRGAEGRIVLAVDHLVGQRELVTRSLPDDIGAHPALSGGAVLSNGEIALIVDCDVLSSTLNTEATALALAR